MSDLDAAYQQKLIDRRFPPSGDYLSISSGVDPEADAIVAEKNRVARTTDQPAVDASITEDQLRADPQFLQDVASIHQAFTGKPFEGDPANLADWGIEKLANFELAMGDMTNPTGDAAGGGMVGQAAQILNNFSPEQAGSFLRALDAYDKLPMFTMPGFGRLVRNVAADPTSVVGVATLGAGLAGRQAGRAAAKEGIKTALRQRIGESILTNPVKVGAAEAAAYTGGGDLIKQNVEIKGGKRDSVDPLQAAGATAIGGAAGAAVMKAAPYVGKAVKAGAQPLSDWVSKLTSTGVRVAGNEFGDGLSGKELRKAAMDFGRTHFVDKSFVNKKTKDEITVPWQGVKHALSGATDPEIRVFYALPDLLEQASYVGKEAPKKSQPEISAVHRYATTAEVAGEALDIGLVVFEDKNGHRFYDHFVIKKTTPAGTSGAASLRAQEKLGSQPAAGVDESVANPSTNRKSAGIPAAKKAAP